MNQQKFHILNGDALKDQFPEQIDGTKIVMRECLMDGPVQGKTLSEFFETRANFFSQHYNTQKSIYHNISESEIFRMIDIPAGSEIYLWFEDDLFCQVNLWFVCSLLQERQDVFKIHLARPPLAYLNQEIPVSLLQNGFGGLNKSLLTIAFENAVSISNQDLSQFASLWNAYQSNDNTTLSKIPDEFSHKFEFVTAAVQAQIDRKIGTNETGKPEEILLKIIAEMETDEFKKIFPIFNERTAIYGFGDLQVKRILERLQKSN